MNASATTGAVKLGPASQPALKTTGQPVTDQHITTTDLRNLTVSTGLRSVDEVLWGDALVDRVALHHLNSLQHSGATAAPGRPVRISD